jgi:Uma2 family endonuclease
MAEPLRWIDEDEEDLLPEDLLPERQNGRTWPAQGEWTYEDYLELLEATEEDDGRRYEVLDGVLDVTPAPRVGHQFSVVRLGRFLDEHVADNGLGLVLVAPVTIKLPGGLRTRAVQPDVVFFRAGNEPQADDKDFRGTPDLVVEVLSPGARNRKRELVRLEKYKEAGVPEHWLVDPKARMVEVHVLQEGRNYVQAGCFGMGEEVRSAVLPKLRLTVARLFMP